MSHIEKQKIFDEYAKSQGYDDWEDLQFDLAYDIARSVTYNGYEKALVKHIFTACDLVQKEQQKRITDNMNWDRCKNKGSECRTDKHELSILSENNLIK